MRPYLRTSGAVFLAVALLHAIRLFLAWPAQLAGWEAPIWISWVALFGAGALCVWAFRLVLEGRE